MGYKSNKFVPNEPKHDDVYIVEFPKSGITWFLTIWTNLLCLGNNEEISVTFYNIPQFIPDIHMSKNVNSSLFRYPGYRFIKSHSRYNKHYNHVIYLLRNPFSVMQSYYRHSKRVEGFKGSFEDFVNDKHRGIEAYVKHVESWLHNNIGSKRLHLIKYEDLRADPEKEILKLVQNLGLESLNQDFINQAIERSVLEKMKQAEAIYEQNHPTYNTGFVNTGQVIPEAEKMPLKVREKINISAKSILNNFYSDNDEVQRLSE